MPERPTTLTPSASPNAAETGLVCSADWIADLRRSGYSRVDHVQVTGSTNADLLAVPLSQTPGGAALRWADHQSAGRGRRGRQWVDAPDQALMLSMAFERAVSANDAGPPVAAFSLVAGLTVVQALKASGLAVAPLRLKWPNDVLMTGRKVAGILVEMKQQRDVQRLVVGCGINLFDPPAAAASPTGGASLPAAGLLGPAPAGGSGLTMAVRENLVTQIAIRMAAAHQDFFASGLGAFLPAWLACHAYQDQPIALSDGPRLLAQGVCRGIDENGSLLVQTDTGVQAFVIGEVSARPVGSVGAQK